MNGFTNNVMSNCCGFLDNGLHVCWTPPGTVVLASASLREAVVEGGGVAAPPGHVARRVAHHGVLVLVRILHPRGRFRSETAGPCAPFTCTRPT